MRLKIFLFFAALIWLNGSLVSSQVITLDEIQKKAESNYPAVSDLRPMARRRSGCSAYFGHCLYPLRVGPGNHYFQLFGDHATGQFPGDVLYPDPGPAGRHVHPGLQHARMGSGNRGHQPIQLPDNSLPDALPEWQQPG